MKRAKHHLSDPLCASVGGSSLVSNTDIWRERDVLVTGATGFLGGWLVDALVDAGARVTALIRSPRPRSYLYLRRLQERIHIVQAGDIADPDAVRHALAGRAFSIAFHLAGRATGPDATDSRGYDVNVLGTRCMIEALRAAPCPGALVLASSLMVYPDSTGRGADEATPPEPANAYGHSKLAAENLAFQLGRDEGVAVGAVRLGNVYGGGDRNYSRLIPGVITTILSGRRPQLRDPAGSERDFIHASDARNAMLKLGGALMGGSLGGETFNIATGRLARSTEVARLVAGLCDRPHFVPETGPGDGTDIPSRGTVTEKAHRLLNWTARTDLDAGLAETVRWYRADASMGVKE